MTEEERLLKEIYQTMAAIMFENGKGNPLVVQEKAREIYMKAAQRLDYLAKEKAYRN